MKCGGCWIQSFNIMTYQEFIEEQRQRLIDFEAYWLGMNHQHPDQFPMDMESGDWDEQLAIFNDNDFI